MSRSRIVALSFCLSCCMAPPALAQKIAPEERKVFLLSGGKRQHHGYRDQALYLSGTLENTGRFEVTIGEDAAILETPSIRKYDLLIVMADRRDPEFKFSEEQQQAIFDFVRSGHGYISIHGADNAAKDWLPAWKEMLGGVFSHVGLPDGKTKKGSYTVKIADTQSPITQGLKDFPLRDELVLPDADDARRPAAGHHRIPGHRLAGRLDPHLRQRPGLPHQSSAIATSGPTRTTRFAIPTSPS